MPEVSTVEFLLWKEKQLRKGGEYQSFSLLLDLKGGISQSQINLIKINQEKKIYVKTSLYKLEKLWDYHLKSSTPIQYLIGFCYWRDLKLEVNNKVLIPRPETELLVDIIFEVINKKRDKKLFADLGTGSGAISIALALANPMWEGLATDINSDALEIASRNFTNNSKHSNLKFYSGNWWDPLEKFKGAIDFAVANPPYIPNAVYEKLPKEVKDFEPKISLVAGQNGLLHIQEIIKCAPFYLKEKGWLMFEHHFDQSPQVKLLFIQNGFSEVQVFKDFSGIGRFTIGRYK